MTVRDDLATPRSPLDEVIAEVEHNAKQSDPFLKDRAGDKPGKGGHMSIIPVRLWTRRCNGCDDSSAHDSHLTWLGRLALFLAARRRVEAGQ